jgi:hypothetical protein
MLGSHSHQLSRRLRYHAKYLQNNSSPSLTMDHSADTHIPTMQGSIPDDDEKWLQGDDAGFCSGLSPIADFLAEYCGTNTWDDSVSDPLIQPDEGFTPAQILSTDASGAVPTSAEILGTETDPGNSTFEVSNKSGTCRDQSNLPDFPYKYRRSEVEIQELGSDNKLFVTMLQAQLQKPTEDSSLSRDELERQLSTPYGRSRFSPNCLNRVVYSMWKNSVNKVCWQCWGIEGVAWLKSLGGKCRRTHHDANAYKIRRYKSARTHAAHSGVKEETILQSWGLELY